MSELTVLELYTRLAHGELSNLTLVDKNTPGVIKDQYKPAVLMQINKAMRDLFTKFNLRQREIVINSQVTITHYFLRNEFAASNDESTQTVKYLDDSACANFGGNVVKILEVYDAFGRQLFMNRSDEPLSVFTPEFDCLQITANHQSEDFYTIFQSLHDKLKNEDDILNIPPALEDPILLLVASKIYGALNGNANSARALQYSQEYEMSLLQAEVRDSISTSENIANSKLDRAGFI